MSFGSIISDARKRMNMSLRELAALVAKEDGLPISPQYLNDIEHDRRNPPSDAIMQQLAKVLHIDLDLLYFHAGEIPEDMRSTPANDQTVREAFKAFRRALQEDNRDSDK